MTTKSGSAAEAVTFETGMQQLEERVRALEAGSLTLAEAMRVFEEGMQLAKTCEVRLAEAKGKVEILLQQADGGTMTAAWSAKENG